MTSAPGVDVLAQHQLVVHLVDVVAGEDDHVFRTVGLDDVDVLVDRVRRALVPLRLRDALARRQDVEALVSLRPQEVPAALQVADQRMRLVLGGDANAADAGVQRVGQREVDDARLAAEIDGGLGAPVGQFLQPAAAPAGKHIGHGVARQRLRVLLTSTIFTLPGRYSGTKLKHDRRQRRQQSSTPRPRLPRRPSPPPRRHCPCPNRHSRRRRYS